ncbi:hypothetical protein [Alkanindiges illinoisensis]|uniref:hypothetical protein n=1 Tax=Alkanindiges illinoisensis TaxID=197183 RepID=UPI0012EC108F|nr:hypothetical protein [Alkanindiges illinoisensis]
MFKNLVKENAQELKKLSEKFVEQYDKDKTDPLLSTLSNQAQKIIVDLLTNIRRSQDAKEISLDIGIQDQIGYFKKKINKMEMKSFWDSFKINGNISTNEPLSLRECANGLVHFIEYDYFIKDKCHWLMFYTDHGNLIILDIQKACDSVQVHC